MKVRFAVNQKEAMRRGVDAPSGIAVLEIDPGKVPPEVRDLLAARLHGRNGHCDVVPQTKRSGSKYLVAPTPTLEGLLEAVQADASGIEPDGGY